MLFKKNNLFLMKQFYFIYYIHKIHLCSVHHRVSCYYRNYYIYLHIDILSCIRNYSTPFDQVELRIQKHCVVLLSY